MSVGNTVGDMSGSFKVLLVDSLGRQIVVGQVAEGAAISGDGSPILVAGRYDVTPRAVDDGDKVTAALDAAGRAIIASPETEDGAVVGQPLLIGGRYDSTPRDLDDGDVGAAALDADGRTLVNTGWTPSLQAEETANDSDKTFTVPAGTEWEVMTIWVELITTATVGNRVISVELQDDSSDVILRIDVGAVQVASLTRYYVFAPWNADLTAFRGASSNLLMTPFPPGLVLPTAYKVRIYDSAAVDAAADDMVLQMMVKSRTV